jgi:sulfofructose kinase
MASSEKFARQLTQQNNPHLALQQMRSLAPNVIITLGQYGLIWAQGKRTGKLPAFSIQAVDSTGAGDAFHGGLAAALSMQKTWEDTLVYASAVAALCCTKIGARPGMPNQTDVNNFMENQRLIRNGFDKK